MLFGDIVLAGRRPDLASLAREPLFLPEHLPAFKALEQFRHATPHVALVIDEHGGVAGLLTLTDVLEALVGDLAQVPGTSVIGPVQRDDGSWLLDGLTMLDDIADLLQLGPASALLVVVVLLLGVVLALASRATPLLPGGT